MVSHNDIYSYCLIGDGALLIACGEFIKRAGHDICCVITSNESVREWAVSQSIDCVNSLSDYSEFLQNISFDYLFSIVHLDIIPSSVLKMARKMAINFHDALLPSYAGIHATSWALINREKKHGITWHVMMEGADKGDILKQVSFDLEPEDTAFTLNLKCYDAGLKTFVELLEELDRNDVARRPQDFKLRSYFGKYKRPKNGGVLSWDSSAEDLNAMVKALEFGKYPNRMGTAKLAVPGKCYVVKNSRVTEYVSSLPPGTITSCWDTGICVATSSFDLELSSLLTFAGKEVQISQFLSEHNLNVLDQLPLVHGEYGKRITELYKTVAPNEDYWVSQLKVSSSLHFHSDYFQSHNLEQGSNDFDVVKIEPAFINQSIKKGDGLENLKYGVYSIASFLAKEYVLDLVSIGISYPELIQRVDNLDSFFSKAVPVVVKDLKNARDLYSTVSTSVDESVTRVTYAQDINLRYPELSPVSKKQKQFPITVVQTESLEGHTLEHGTAISLILVGDSQSYLLFRKDVFNGKKGVNFVNRLANYLTTCSTEGGALSYPISKESERKDLMDVDPRVDVNVCQLLKKWAIETPQAVAVVCEEDQLTYHELNGKVEKVARYLKHKGIGKEKSVGIYMNRTVDLLVSMLAVLKSGAAYVPLDPIYPAERIEWMIQDAGLSLILTEQGIRHQLPNNNSVLCSVDSEWDKIEALKSVSELEANEFVDPDELAYIIYTSGSTGNPKGVEVTHRGLTNFLCSMAEKPGFTNQDRILALTTICFDISGLELFLPLVVGGQVEILTTDVSRDGFKLKEKIENGYATVVQATPATWEMLINAGWEKKMNIKILCGGEALSEDLATKLCERGDEVWNLYGPTETTIWSSISKVRPGEKVTIGQPIANTQIYVLDEELYTVPTGVEGDIYIGGAGVAKGYRNRPNLTNERFIPNPFDASKLSKLYKTGDAGKLLPDGSFECLGRKDNQVKLRGYRIDLEEIEAVIERETPIEKAIVTVREDDRGYKSLVAFVKHTIGNVPDKAIITDAIQSFLPSYMIPMTYLFVERHPLTPNYKVDRKWLSITPIKKIKDQYGLMETMKEEEKDLSENQDDLELVFERLSYDLTNIVAEIVGEDASNISDSASFGEVGFDSIRFTTLSMSIKDKFQVMISPAQFFTHSSLNKLTNFMIRTHGQDLSNYYGVNAEPVNHNKKMEQKNKKSLNTDNVFVQEAEGEISLHKSEPVAVIGLWAKMPQSPDLESFWNNLVHEKDLTTPIPVERWDMSGESLEDDITNWGGFIQDADKFDASFFNISPREAEQMDPQQRIFLEGVWKAIENAGYRASDLSDTNTGVFVGAVGSDYWDLMNASSTKADAYTISGNVNCVIANRVSYLLNLRGESSTIDTACSSSLVAVHRAVSSIQNGNCDVAIAGGVNLLLNPFLHTALNKNGMLSPDGKCKSFDSEANGYVRGEGAGVVLLKPLRQALKDGDNIQAVIKGSFENHGGRTNSLTAPSPNAQADLIEEAYRKARIDPSTVTYVETHGSGTSLGDPIEINGLKMGFERLYQDWRINTPKTAHCVLGTVKTNIGHLEAAAGIAGLIKVILSMKNATIPGLLHFNKQNPYIELEGSPFSLAEKTAPWERIKEASGKTLPRRAGVSSFGFGGSNAHVVLEEFIPVTSSTKSVLRDRFLFTLSARNKGRLKSYAMVFRDYLGSLESNPVYSLNSNFLHDMVYTLQVGREPMEERMAILFTDLSELRGLINNFIEGHPNPGKLFTGNIKEFNKGTALIIEGEEGEEYIRNIIYKNKIGKLAQLWVMGVEINWRLFNDGSQHKRIPLPTYPFEKVRHWLQPLEIGGKDGDRALSLNKGTVLHPFIDVNESTLTNQIYRKKLSKHDAFIKDHIVDGNVIFPGVAYLEMARAAGSLAYGKGVTCLRGNYWSKPLELGEESTDVYIALKKEEEDVLYEIVSKDVTGVRHVHAQGKVLYEEKVTGTQEYLPLKEIQRRCTNHITAQECYKMFTHLGFQYEKMYKPLTDVYHNENESLARIVIPLEMRGDEAFELHPSLLEGGLQTVIGILANVTEDSCTPFLPFGVDELQIQNPLTSACYVYMKAVEKHGNAGKELRKYDIWMADKNGKILVKIKGYSLRPYFDKSRDEDESEKLYIHNMWESKPLEIKKTDRSHTGNVLLFELKSGSSNLGNIIPDSQIFSVVPGERYLEEGNIYTINPEVPFDYIRLIESLKARNSLPDTIIHCWGDEKLGETKKHIENQLNCGIYSIFHLVKALLDQESILPSRIAFVYQGPIDEQPQYAALGSFFKTIHQEIQKVDLKLIHFCDFNDTSLNTTAWLLETVLEEIESGEDLEVRYVERERFVKKYYDNSNKVTQGTSSRNFIIPENVDGKVYLITGGTGSLGLIMAKFLASKGRVKLVLVGTKELTSGKLAQIRNIENHDIEVLYLKTDVSNQEEVKELVNKVRHKFGKIDGIIHGAGVLRDSYFINKTEVEIKEVFASKVYGTVWLDEATKNDHLDFFIMFSSISAPLGNAGQADYAFANSFMDYFSLLRDKYRSNGKRYGKSLTINWSLWKEGGMRLDDQNQQLLRNSFGILPISTEEGLSVFEENKENTNNFIFTKGNKSKILKTLNDRQIRSLGVATAANKDKDNIDDEQSLLQEMVTLCAEILKMDKDQLETDRDISEYGFDSMTNTELANEMNKRYGLDITPVMFFEYTTLSAIVKQLIAEDESKWKSLFKGTHDNQIEDSGEAVEEFASVIIHDQFQQSNSKVTRKDDDNTRSSGGFKELNEPVAIIGMSGIMPQSEDLDEFWAHIRAGKDLITEVPSDRWDWKEFYGSRYERNKTHSKWGGFMKEIDKFDHEFFQIPWKEAALMDPQQRLFLETVWSALEDAGYKSSTLSGTNTGVYVGLTNRDYYDYLKGQDIEVDAEMAFGNNLSFLVNRVSYQFNLKGPSEVVDTLCSSSLTAIHKAVNDLRHGHCDMAIAGGISVIMSPSLSIAFTKAGMLSEDDKCKTFDADANGFVRGEGSGAIILKPLSKALEDGDRIYALIKGTAINHGGRANTLTTPNLNAQAEVVQNAIIDANIDPSTIGYVEVHGTGTPLGDPIEFNSLKKGFAEAFKQYGGQVPDKPFCGLGSVKTNVGHLESASGMASVFKVILAMKNKELPANLHLQELNPYIKPDGSPFYIVDRLSRWKDTRNLYGEILPRRAGISAFGAGGLNAHLIIEDYNEEPSIHPCIEGPKLFILSAKNQESLRQYALRLKRYVEEKGNYKDPSFFENLAFTMQVGREGMKERLAVIADNRNDLMIKLHDFISGNGPIQGVMVGTSKQKNIGKMAKVLGKTPGYSENSLQDIAEQWLEGYEVDWKLLYKPGHTKKISAPTYPFARTRCWIDRKAEGMQVINGPVHMAHFQYDEPFVKNHLVFGNRVLLGVTYAALAFEVASVLRPEKRLTNIRRLLFSNPLTIGPGEKATVRTYVQEQEGNFALNTVYTKSGQTEHHKAASGTLLFDMQQEKATIDINRFLRNWDTKLEGLSLYRKRWSGAISYGPSLYTINNLWIQEQEVLSEVSMPEECLISGINYKVHPAWLDAAVVSGLSAFSEDTANPYIPFMIRDIIFHEDVTSARYAHCKLVKKNNEIIVLDCCLCNERGVVLLEMNGFTCKKITEQKANNIRLLEKSNSLKEDATLEVSATLSGDADMNLNPESASQISDLTEVIKDYLSVKIAYLLNEDPEEIPVNRNFMDLGMDSSSLMNFTEEIEKELEVELSPTLFFEYQNIEELSTYFKEDHKDNFLSRALSENLSGTKGLTVSQEQPKPKVINGNEKDGCQKEDRREPVVTKVLHQEADDQDVAVIGMSGLFAGSTDLRQLWENIRGQKDLITEIPLDHFDYRPWFDEKPQIPDKMYSKWGGFISDVDRFDAAFFNISRREAEVMDPQLRLLLQQIYAATDDAGYSGKVRGTKTGMYVGACFHDYQQRMDRSLIPVGPHDATGNAATMLANRPSFYFDLKGPSLLIDTACSSSLIALHTACKALQRKECDMAYAAGVNLLLESWHYRYFCRIGALSPTGRSHTFTDKADGYVPAEGVTAVLLKPLKRAVEDGDNIHAVIKGSAINHGGYTSSITAPSVKLEAQVILDAWKDARIDPETIGYIEAHGTGTKLGDPIEIDGIKSAFAQHTNKTSFCAVGSAKAHIGHTEGAAGLAGVIKTILAMKNKEIPAMPGFKSINPYIKLDGSPLYINKEVVEWPKIKGEQRRAGVSSFGAGGAYAHVVLEEYERVAEQQNDLVEKQPQIFVMSAKDENRLNEYAEKMIEFLKTDSNFPIGEGPLAEENCSILEDLKVVIAEVTGIHPTDILEDDSIQELGLDRVSTVLVIEKMQEKYQADFMFKFTNWDDHTIQSLVMLFKEKVSHVSCSTSSLSSYSENTILAKMAYTLQTGREAMDNRLALIAADRQELTYLLSEFLSGNEPKDRWFQGRAKIGRKVAHQINRQGISGEEYETMLVELAKDWVSGAEVDWEVLYRDHKPKRMTLPSYPFAKNRYWIEELDKSLIEQKEGNSHTEKIHALIDSNVSTFKEQKYMTTLQGTEFFIMDHIIGNYKVLPGVVYLEMARVAGELASEKYVSSISNTVWMRPVEVANEPKQLLMTVNQVQDEIEFEFYTMTEGHDKLIHTQGKITLNQDSRIDSQQSVNIKSVLERTTERASKESFYAQIRNLGLNLGDNYRVVNEIFRNKRETLSQLIIPTALRGDLANIDLHPSLMDGAFQTAIWGGYYDTLHVPYELRRMEVFGSLPEECFVYAEREEEKGSLTGRANISITDMEGRVLVRIEGFLSRPVKRKGESDKTDKATDLLALLKKLEFGELNTSEVEQMIEEVL
ncbi:amino acid adenylation domain-containing protein [Bacillus cereus group sp. MYBK134-1]|uniref:amino acid adenylation domain-containing protein n=1 Tax=unclassified Bacillus cereus group TaxID=2750818 RepID=UPI003F7AC0F3